MKDETTLELVTTKPADNNGHAVMSLNAQTIKAMLKSKNANLSGKELQQQVRDILRERSGGASDMVAGFVRDGGMLKSVRASQTKDGRKVLVTRFEQPKVSEIEVLRAQLADALAKLQTKQIK